MDQGFPRNANLEQKISYLPAPTKDAASEDKPADDARDISKNLIVPPGSEHDAQLGERLLHEEKYEDAEDAFYSIFEKHSNSLYATVNIGVCLMKLGRPDTALNFLESAYRLAPGNAAVCSRLGTVYAEQNKLDAAIKLLTNAKGLDPNDEYTEYALGTAYLRQRQWDQAKTELGNAVKLAANDGNAHFGLAWAWAYGQPARFDLARNEYQRGLDLHEKRDTDFEKQIGYALK